MRVYQFMSAEDGLKALTARRLKISRLDSLNDPFEFLGVDISDRSHRKALRDTKAELAKSKGLLCFCKNWRNPVLWAHYAHRHQGLCLGFDMADTYLTQVSYVNSRFTWPDTIDEAFMQRLLFTKFLHWSYENEYRALVSLDTPVDGMYFMDFSKDLILKQVLVGAESSLTRDQISQALGDWASNVETFKVRPAFRSFRMVRNRDETLWV